MSEQTAGKGNEENRDGARPEAQAERSGGLVEQDAPNKQHGDALQHGSGTRHGVHGPDRKPDGRG